MADSEVTTTDDPYSMADHTIAGGLVFFSGVIGVEANGVPPQDPARQFGLVFQALDAALRNAGRSRADLVDLQTFHVGYPKHMDVFAAAKRVYLGPLKTCWTAIGVAAAGMPGTLVEVRAIARFEPN